jgi:hypothetical protein
VSVNDGFTSAVAQSGAFQAAGVAPTSTMLPAVGTRLQAGIPTVLAGSGLDDRQRALPARGLTWFAGASRLGTGPKLRVALPPGTTRLRLVARDATGSTATTTRTVAVAPVALTLRRASAPTRVRPGARRVTVTVATSVPATVRVGGRRFRVGPRAVKLRVPLPRAPKRGVLKSTLKITADGVRQPAITQTVVVLRA